MLSRFGRFARDMFIFFAVAAFGLAIRGWASLVTGLLICLVFGFVFAAAMRFVESTLMLWRFYEARGFYDEESPLA